jgi:hypothetical protein
LPAAYIILDCGESAAIILPMPRSRISGDTHGCAG